MTQIVYCNFDCSASECTASTWEGVCKASHNPIPSFPTTPVPSPQKLYAIIPWRNSPPWRCCPQNAVLRGNASENTKQCPETQLTAVRLRKSIEASNTIFYPSTHLTNSPSCMENLRGAGFPRFTLLGASSTRLGPPTFQNVPTPMSQVIV